MAKVKYKAPKYAHQSYPAMVFHPEHGSYLIVEDKASIPDGFVTDIKDCANPPVGTNEPAPCMNVSVDNKHLTKAQASKKTAKSVDELDELKAELAELKAKLAKGKTSTKPKVEEKVEDANDDDDGEPVTLAELKLKRKDALVILDEAKIEYAKNASNLVIAGLVADLLDSEED